MTELKQLRADLATIQEAAEIAKIRGFHELAGNYDQVEGELKQKIAKLEEQQELIDPWKRAKEALYHWDQNDREPDYITKRSIFAYIQNLQAKVNELNHELRCERIDGGKVRDDRKAIDAEKSREKLAELTTIYNAIPPACGLARELVEKRIEGVKKEMQESEAGQ